MSVMSIEGITVMGMASLIVFFYIQLPLSDYLTFAIPWLIIYAYLTSNITSMIFMMTSYLIILSLTANIKFKRFQTNVKKLKVKANLSETYSKLFKNYSYFIAIMEENYKTNILWKHLITVDLFYRLIIINFICFVVFFYTLNPLIWCAYQMMFFNESCAFFTLLIQVTGIHNETVLAANDLRTWISFKPYNKTISFKLKVCFHFILFFFETKSNFRFKHSR